MRKQIFTKYQRYLVEYDYHYFTYVAGLNHIDALEKYISGDFVGNIKPAGLKGDKIEIESIHNEGEYQIIWFTINDSKHAINVAVSKAIFE